MNAKERDFQKILDACASTYDDPSSFYARYSCEDEYQWLMRSKYYRHTEEIIEHFSPDYVLGIANGALNMVCAASTMGFDAKIIEAHLSEKGGFHGRRGNIIMSEDIDILLIDEIERNKDVVILDDTIDSGRTLSLLTRFLEEREGLNVLGYVVMVNHREYDGLDNIISLMHI